MISVVVPCFNEEEGIVAMYERLAAVLRQLDMRYEMVFVNDGSRDGTETLLRSLFHSDPHVVVISLSRNFGHQPTVTAGMAAARGDVVVVIDADLQDPPELIPDMIDLWRQGYQVVYGVRTSREGESMQKLWLAKLFYRFINMMSDIEIPLDTGDFRLLDRCVVDAFARMPERHRLLRGMASWIGFNQIGFPYHRAARAAGESKYPAKKMLGLAMDGIISFSVVPLRLVTLLGFTSATIAFLGIVYSIAVRLLTHSWVRGWAMSFIGMLFMSGTQMLCLGILGEYIGRIYTESKQRPLFLEKEILRAPSEPIAAIPEPVQNELASSSTVV